MGPSFGGQRHPRGGADQNGLSAGVDAVGPRFQSPFHERVVEHADRKQWLSPAAPGGAQLADQAHQVRFGNAQFHVLSGRLFPPVHDGFVIVVEPVAPFVGRPDPHLVEPPGEIGRGADVRANSDDALGDFGRLAGEIEQGAAQCGLSGRHGRRCAAEVAGHRGRRRHRHVGPVQPLGGGRAQSSGRARVGEARPGTGRVLAQEFDERAVRVEDRVDLDLEQRPPARVEGRGGEHLGVHLAQPLEPRNLHLRVRPQAGQDLLLVRVVARPVALLAHLDSIQGRLRDVDVALADQVGHVAEEEGQQERRDVVAVRVGVHQQDDFAVAQAVDVELLADAAADRGHEVA